MSAEFVERRMTAEGGALTYAEAGTGAAIVVIGESGKPTPAHGLLATDRRVLLFAPPGTRTPPRRSPDRSPRRSTRSGSRAST